MSEDIKIYNNGPDQLILEADSVYNWHPDGAVKIRDHDPESLIKDPPISVPSILERAAKKYPDHPAMCVKRDGAWVEWTYNMYHQESRTVAKAFIKLGLERFCSVGILGFNAPEWFIAQMGAIMAGGFSVGIYTTNSSDACKYIADNCKANIIVVEDEKQLEKVLKFKSELSCIKVIFHT
jgi:long-chain-fatty-acid--CoA ligase ACSBG